MGPSQWHENQIMPNEELIIRRKIIIMFLLALVMQIYTAYIHIYHSIYGKSYNEIKKLGLH